MVFGVPSRIFLRGGCHKCHISHIEMKNSKNTPLFPPLDTFSEKPKIKPPIYMAQNRYFPDWIGYRLFFVLVSYSLSIFINSIKQGIKC